MQHDEGRRPIPARNTVPMRAIAHLLAAKGVVPDAVSLFGLAVGVCSGVLLGLTSLWPDFARPLWIGAALLVVLRGISNVLDGLVAVEESKGSPTGVFYNEFPDRISDMALMVGAGYSLGGSPVAGWLAACLAVLVAYVRALGVIAGAPTDFGGPFAKQQRMFSLAAVAAILALTPYRWHFVWGPGGYLGPMAAWLWVMVPGIVLTIILRLRRAVRAVALTRNSG